MFRPTQKFFLRFLAFSLLITSCAAISLRAQTPAQDSDDDDEQRAYSLTLSVTISEDGNALVSAYAFAPSVAPDMQQMLNAVFHCTLENKVQRTKGFYSSKCVLPVQQTGRLHAYRIDTHPLVEYAHQNHIDSLSLQLTLPETEIRETTPRTEAATFAPSGKLHMRSAALARLKQHMAATRAFAWRTNAPIPESIEVRLGYHPATLRRAALLLLAAFCAPIALALWLRRRALSAQTPDKSSVWFSYLRCQAWLLNGSLVCWWAAGESAHADNLTRFLLSNHDSRWSWLSEPASILLTWVPPVLAWILCVVISQPVQEKLRGMHWTRKELVLQAVYSVSSALLPLLLGIKGIGAISHGAFRTGVLCILAAVIVKFAARMKLLKLLGMQPQALTTGDLRDAAFAMAQRLGVKLQQIFVIPAGKGQMANAFARSGNTIAFTDYLLQRMSRREVNYILGHELSHLRLNHLQKLSYALVGSLAAGVFLYTSFSSFLPESAFLRFGLFFAVMTLIPYFWSRRFEFSADAGAVEATGDPEAAISALFKLASLNMHPLHWSKWSEKWLTHPSTLRRAQAIARKASIPLERLPGIARSAMESDSHYTLPASAIAGNKVLSSTKKAQNAVHALLAMLGAIILTPTAVALLVKFTHLTPQLQRLTYLAGFAASVATYLTVCNFVPVHKLRRILEQLKRKVQTEGVQIDAWNAITVGLAPGPLPRTYEGHPHWDFGFLFLRSDRICYWGEETRFALRRDQITEIQLGPSTPNLLGSKRIYIAWRDAERGACGVLSFGSVDAETVLTLRRRTTQLFRQLLEWRTSSSPARALPAPLDSLVAPAFGSVTGVSPKTLCKRERVLKQMYLFGLLAAGVAVVAGLPFHLFDALIQAPITSDDAPQSVGSGWYVVGVALSVILVQYVPYFRYKDAPVLQANLGTHAVPKGSRSDAFEQSAPETETVNIRD